MLNQDNRFKTVDEALTFCKQFGLDMSAANEQLFDIANSLLIANHQPQKTPTEHRNARGFKIKPIDTGMSFFKSNEDTVFNGVTERFAFIVIAKDQAEADAFAKHALGPIEFEWEQKCQWIVG